MKLLLIKHIFKEEGKPMYTGIRFKGYKAFTAENYTELDIFQGYRLSLGRITVANLVFLMLWG